MTAPQRDKPAEWGVDPVPVPPSTATVPTSETPPIAKRQPVHQRTGDEAIDQAIAQLERATAGTLHEQLLAGEDLQRTLQARLADLRTG